MSVIYINEVVLQLKSVRSTLLSIVKIHRLPIASVCTDDNQNLMRYQLYTCWIGAEAQNSIALIR